MKATFFSPHKYTMSRERSALTRALVDLEACKEASDLMAKKLAVFDERRLRRNARARELRAIRSGAEPKHAKPKAAAAKPKAAAAKPKAAAAKPKAAAAKPKVSVETSILAIPRTEEAAELVRAFYLYGTAGSAVQRIKGSRVGSLRYGSAVSTSARYNIPKMKKYLTSKGIGASTAKLLLSSIGDNEPIFVRFTLDGESFQLNLLQPEIYKGIKTLADLEAAQDSFDQACRRLDIPAGKLKYALPFMSLFAMSVKNGWKPGSSRGNVDAISKARDTLKYPAWINRKFSQMINRGRLYLGSAGGKPIEWGPSGDCIPSYIQILKAMPNELQEVVKMDEADFPSDPQFMVAEDSDEADAIEYARANRRKRR